MSNILARFENVSKRYGNTQALKDVSFQICEGDLIGFLGPNGAGKTTVMRILSGYCPPTSGKVWLHDRELFKHPHEAKQHIGYLPESINLYPDMRVEEFLRFVTKLKGVPPKRVKEQLAEKMEQCGLWEVKRRLIGRLSKGYRQRVGIAQALIGDPSILILDEPTNGLDPQQIAEVRGLIRNLSKNRALILSTHILPEVHTVCTKVLMIMQGEIIASGAVHELEACLKDREEIFITIKGRKYREEAVKLLQATPGVGPLKILDEVEGQVSFSFEAPQNIDLRPRITELFVRQQIPLLEIHRAKLSLEDIFLRLINSQKASKEAS